MTATRLSTLSHIAACDKAEIPPRRCPHIRKFHGKTMVIGHGGNAMTDRRCRRPSPKTWCC